MKTIVGTELGQGQRRREEFHIRSRHEIPVGIQFIECLAGFRVDDQQPPFALTRRNRRQKTVSALTKFPRCRCDARLLAFRNRRSGGFRLPKLLSNRNTGRQHPTNAHHRYRKSDPHRSPLANYVPGKYSRNSKKASLGAVCGGPERRSGWKAPRLRPETSERKIASPKILAR